MQSMSSCCGKLVRIVAAGVGRQTRGSRVHFSADRVLLTAVSMKSMPRRPSSTVG